VSDHAIEEYSVNRLKDWGNVQTVCSDSPFLGTVWAVRSYKRRIDYL